MNFKTFSELQTDILKNLYKIPEDIDLIVGVPRSGLLVANMIALILNKPITDVEGLFNDRLISAGKTKNTDSFVVSVASTNKILIVEDSVSSGKSINEVKEKVANSGLRKEFFYLAAYVEAGTKNLVDIFFEIIPQPRAFEWNLFHHGGVIPNSCFDFDGVLCVDPSNEDNDDGINYVKFLEGTRPLILPTRKIGWIVTSRLEKYRPQTEKWLENHNVKYDKLIMLNCTAEERRNNSLHGKFKAQIYKKLPATLFVESSFEQAVEICNLTKKPVFCIETASYLNGTKNFEKKQIRKSKIRQFLKKFRFIRWLYSKIKK